MKDKCNPGRSATATPSSESRATRRNHPGSFNECIGLFSSASNRSNIPTQREQAAEPLRGLRIFAESSRLYSGAQGRPASSSVRAKPQVLPAESSPTQGAKARRFCSASTCLPVAQPLRRPAAGMPDAAIFWAGSVQESPRSNRRRPRGHPSGSAGAGECGQRGPRTAAPDLQPLEVVPHFHDIRLDECVQRRIHSP